jgi:leucine-zipper-like transcriptional regulator 1
LIDGLISIFIEDFKGLINNENESDIKLIFEKKTIHSHKLFLSRSPFFQNMLNSGMSESSTGIINMETSYDTMKEILFYIYSDRIEVTPTNCVAVLIETLLFGLGVLATSCRGMVSENINEKNALQVLEVAEYYADNILKKTVN